MDFLVDGAFVEWVAHFCMAAAGLGCLYILSTAVVVLRHQQSARISPSPQISVTVLKPLHGAEPRLLQRLLSFCRQDYAGPVQIVCGIQRPDDPAIAVVERLRAVYPNKNIALKIETREHGANRKMSNLINMSVLAQYETLVLADSDIEVGPGYLADIIHALQQPGVGAVTCLYHGVAEGGIWAKLSQLSINAYFLPNVVTAVNFGLARPCFGSTIALQSDAFKRIGGLSAFADCLADDYAIGEALHIAGYTVSITSFTVAHACNQRSFQETWNDDVRAARTIRMIDPVGYLGSIITNPLPFALIGALLGSSDAITMIALALACRVALCICVERSFSLQRQPYWLLPLRDLMSFAVYMVGLFGNAVSWRGAKYRVMAKGTMIQESNSVQP